MLMRNYQDPTLLPKKIATRRKESEDWDLLFVVVQNRGRDSTDKKRHKNKIRLVGIRESIIMSTHRALPAETGMANTSKLGPGAVLAGGVTLMMKIELENLSRTQDNIIFTIIVANILAILSKIQMQK
mmetsp:Transcript_23016/g.34679  ORF Transcript_23016/g.34679 Transcript_23016/m.34679 type:complete len:128 (-) Transcript_23016:831-1214(-)